MFHPLGFRESETMIVLLLRSREKRIDENVYVRWGRRLRRVGKGIFERLIPLCIMIIE